MNWHRSYWQMGQPNLCGILILSCILGGETTLADEAGAEKIPVERIVLFNSGVGFFEHRGEVQGDDEVELQFKTSDINDLLKSMVLQDLGGGQISTVSYESRDPITKTLQTFAIDLTSNPTLFQLLSQIRGQELIVHAPNEIRGTLVNAESRPQAVPGGEPIQADYINLLTDEGLQSLALASISRIQIADPELEKEFRTALKILASAHATDKKTVTLKFLGEGRRPVRVGYIREAPVWKTSYRLVLSDGDDDNAEAPLLQGWAIVENTGDQDWKDVQLSLVSGRPISFQMDLYSPLYATRPMVEHELYASLRPQVYDQNMSGPSDGKAVRLGKSMRGRARSAPAMSGRKSERISSFGRDGGGGLGGGYGGEYQELAAEGRDLVTSSISSVGEAGEAGEVGELFRYDIAMPVTLERQHSAMLPIVNQAVETSKVSIFNQSVHAKHPLNGVRLKNTSGLHLMQGPITVFDGGMYAGDAKILDLPAGDERLVSYAMDLDVEVATKHEAIANQLVSVKLAKGMLRATSKFARKWSYTIKNSSDKAKTVLVEHPLEADWNLVEPKQADETTRNRYRFAVEVSPKEPAKLTVRTERTRELVHYAGKVDYRNFQIYLSAAVVSEEMKSAIKEIQRRRTAINELTQQSQQRTSELAVIDQEQSRIRNNMQQLPRNSELYKRYIKKFTEQEDEVERLRAEVRELKAAAVQKEKEMQEYVSELEVE